MATIHDSHLHRNNDIFRSFLTCVYLPRQRKTVGDVGKVKTEVDE